MSLRVTDTDRETAFNVAGRGEMSLSILIETMRREGYEFQVSPARVLYQEIDGVKCEPIERLVVDAVSYTHLIHGDPRGHGEPGGCGGSHFSRWCRSGILDVALGAGGVLHLSLIHI